jgi:hypothetical protein
MMIESLTKKPSRHDNADDNNDNNCSALPAEIQAAYVTLGWYKAMWEAQAEPDSEDMEWDELSAEQQTAAAALGYDKGTEPNSSTFSLA